MNVGMFGDGCSCRMIHENERLVADSCDESDEGSIGLSGEVLPSGFPGQELIEVVLPVCGWLVSECRMCMVLD